MPQSSRALNTVEPWIVRLEVEHYGEKERQELYRRRIPVLPRKVQLIAQHGMGTALEKLSSPLEIQKFFDALTTIEEGLLNNSRRLLSTAIDRAHRDSIELTVINQVQERADLRSAIVLWGLLRTTDKLPLGMLRTLEAEFADRDDHFSNGVMPLVQFFVSARNFRQNEDIVSYYHPRVEAGLEQIVDESAVLAARTLGLLVERLSLSDNLGRDFGPKSAARLVSALDQKPNIQVSLSQQAARNIDAWIERELGEEDTNFEETLEVAALAGSLHCNVAETARYLLNRRDRSFGGMSEWSPLNRDEEWYARIRADLATHRIVEQYLVDVLPDTHSHFPRLFAEDISRLVPGVSALFQRTAKRAVYLGVLSCADAIVEGALCDLDGFEDIVDMAVDVLSPSSEEQQKAEERYLAIVNGEHSEDYAEFLTENDDGYTAGVFLQNYVTALRRERGWTRIAEHRWSSKLIGYWLKDLEGQAEQGDIEPEELSGAFERCAGSSWEVHFWNILSDRWDSTYLAPLVERLVKGHVERKVRQSALRCLMLCEPDEIGRIAENLLSDAKGVSLVEIAIDLGHWLRYRGPDGQRVLRGAASARAGLPPSAGELSEASSEILRRKKPPLSVEARDLLGKAQEGSADVRRLRVVADGYVPLDVDNDVKWLLRYSEEDDVACDAIEGAIRRNMTDEVNAALKHKFACVSARALVVLAEREDAPLPDRYLAMVGTKGNPVRKALVDLLHAKPHPDHLPTLLELARDTWSKRSHYYGDEDDFPIARAAISAIDKVGPVPIEHGRQLYHIAIESGDQDLRTAIFALLAKTGNPKIQAHLLELAVGRGRPVIGRAAAISLVQEAEDLTLDVAGRIEHKYLATVPPAIAVNLTLLLADRAEIGAVRRAAEALSTDQARRVLLLLMVWRLKDRDLGAAKMVASMLPSNHTAIDWAFGDGSIAVNDSTLADLGDADTCAEALVHMQM